MLCEICSLIGGELIDWDGRLSGFGNQVDCAVERIDEAEEELIVSKMERFKVCPDAFRAF